VKAMTTCSIGSSDPVEEPGSAEQYEVGTYDQLITTLNLVQHGDVIQLINDITIKPDNTFPNHLGVWEPFVFNKSITIDGGTTQFKLSFERGLPLALQANIIFKNMNLAMIPEAGIGASYVYVSDA